MANKTETDLLKQFEEKKKEIQEKKKDHNGRLTGNDIFVMYVATTGQNPFTGQPYQTDRQGNPVNTGIGTTKYPNARQFSVKLKKNEKELRENLAILQRLFPSLDEKLQDRSEEYNEKRKDIIEQHRRVEDISKFKDLEVKALLDEKGQEKLENLEVEYEDLIKEKERIDEEIAEILNEPLCKCDFEMITEDDVQDAGLSVQQQQQIEPMLDY